MNKSTGVKRMSWNYRVTFRPTSADRGYEIREVYYNEDGEISLYSVDPATAFADSTDELEVNMNLMVDAFNSDVVNLDNVDYQHRKINLE